MKDFIFKKLLGKSGDFFSGEGLKKIGTIMSQFGIIEEVANKAMKEFESFSDKIRETTDIPCEMIILEKLDLERLKEIIQETKEEGAIFSALLNEGRNKKDELELFLQYLNSEKQAIDMNKVICIRCQMLSEELREKFGDRNLLVIKL
jgi:hypothetical protein